MFYVIVVNKKKSLDLFCVFILYKVNGAVKIYLYKKTPEAAAQYYYLLTQYFSEIGFTHCVITACKVAINPGS